MASTIPAAPPSLQKALDRLGLGGARPPATPTLPFAAIDVAPPMRRLPQTLEALTRLSDEEKIMLAAVTASGCDAVALYTPDAKGGFAKDDAIALYPGVGNIFPATLANYSEGTFATGDATAANSMYQIPVYTRNHALQAIIALRAPTDDYSRVQTATEKATDGDLHEPAALRKAKLEMAAYIVQRHQDLFGVSGQILKQRTQQHRTIEEKLDYFTGLAKHMFATLPTRSGESINPDDFDTVRLAQNPGQLKAALGKLIPWYDTDQAAHVVGVSDLTKLAMDALNADQQPPVVSAEQIQLIELMALLHDVGKTQMSGGFFKAWETPVSPEEQQRRSHYATAENHNHPLFSLLTQLFYEQEGMIAASHHHGLFRYTQEELQEKLGSDFQRYSILADNLPPEKLSPLAKILRVADVAEAISDNGRTDKTLQETVMELVKSAGYDAQSKTVCPVGITAKTIDPDTLCFMIDHGVIKAYGEQRDRESGLWLTKDGRPKYDEKALAAASAEILTAFGWLEKKAAVESALRHSVRNDPLIRDNPPGRAQAAAQR